MVTQGREGCVALLHPPPTHPPQYPMGDLKMFGYASATGLRIIVAIRDVLLREDRVRETMRALHRLFTDACSNPFAPLDLAGYSGADLGEDGYALTAACPSFEGRLAQVVAAADKAVAYTGPTPF